MSLKNSPNLIFWKQDFVKFSWFLLRVWKVGVGKFWVEVLGWICLEKWDWWVWLVEFFLVNLTGRFAWEVCSGEFFLLVCLVNFPREFGWFNFPGEFSLFRYLGIFSLASFSLCFCLNSFLTFISFFNRKFLCFSTRLNLPKNFH